jgi:trigger factor
MSPSERETGAIIEESGEGEAPEQEKPKLTLDVKVEKPTACERHVTVTIARDDVDRYLTEAYDELAPEAQVPGFRPGKAPRELIEKRFKRQIQQQVKASILMDALTQVNEGDEFSAISEPDFDFDAVEIPDEGPLTFEFDIEVRPEFTMPEWKGLELEKPVRDFTDEDVDYQVTSLLGRYGQLVPVEDAAKTDDYVAVDITFQQDGKVVGKEQEQTLRVRPTLSFHDAQLEGFDKLMIGAKAGDVREAKVTVTQDSPRPELRGEEVACVFNILEVKRLELPELDQNFLERIGGFENGEQMREAVLSDLERQLTYHQERQIRRQITKLLTESANWDLPPDLLRRQARRELERAVMELQAAGFGEEQIRAYENELRQNSMASTARALKEHFILERIAEEQKIEAAPEDYDREIELIAAQQGDSPRRVRARFEKRGLMDSLHNQIIERKAMALIREHAKIKETTYEPERPKVHAADVAVGGRSEEDAAIPEAKYADAGQEELKTHGERERG